MECLEELVTRGALWRPNDRSNINSLRRSLYGSEAKVTVNLLQLFTKNGTCSEEAIRELLKPPKMSQHLASESWHLARLQLEPDGRKKVPKPKAASPALLAQYNREELYERIWTEPTRTVAKSYRVSDVWLSKVCKALKVPVPGRGYWAKKAAGKPVKKRPTLPFFKL